jgi:hypothetical protein
MPRASQTVKVEGFSRPRLRARPSRRRAVDRINGDLALLQCQPEDFQIEILVAPVRLTGAGYEPAIVSRGRFAVHIVVGLVVRGDLERVVEVGPRCGAQDHLSGIIRIACDLDFRIARVTHALGLLHHIGIPRVVRENVGVRAGFAMRSDAADLYPSQRFEFGLRQIVRLRGRTNEQFKARMAVEEPGCDGRIDRSENVPSFTIDTTDNACSPDTAIRHRQAPNQ